MRVRVIIPKPRRPAPELVPTPEPEDPRIAERLDAIEFSPARVYQAKPVQAAPALDASELLTADFPFGTA